MKRITARARPDWEQKVEEQGLVFHHVDGRVYWDESAHYRLSGSEVDELEDATNELNRLCMEAVAHIVKSGSGRGLPLPFAALRLIEWSWNQEQPSVYGRMDLAYDGINPPKLLEFNADTPTSLLESSVIQWHWLQETFPNGDQFNSIHERLVDKWKSLKTKVEEPVFFGYVPDPIHEDLVTATYMRETADEAELNTADILMQDIGWADGIGFVDLEDNAIKSLFKLYPWEWLLQEQFSGRILQEYTGMTWVEPLWKVLLSNKWILPVLWELFPGHPNLLEARHDGPGRMTEFVKKPLFSREGANITLRKQDSLFESKGPYGKEGFVYQALAPVTSFGGKTIVVGSWVIDGESAGIGIRESEGPITDHTATFVPHLME